ncbi:PQQ-dependent sugar dehydrogenase [soil metagenome]
MCAGLLYAGSQAQAQAIRLEPVLTGLSSPVLVTHARDRSKRQFIVEQTGRIRVRAPGASTTSVFLDLSTKIIAGGERGLLGLAFHPQFATNARFFVNYTRASDGATVIAEYRAGANPTVTAASEIVLMTIAQPFANHNGGMVEFGPDGFLYIGMGDGGSANDPGNRAQNINDLLGKMLRIDVDHPANGLPYSSPAGNPYVGAQSGRPEIFAIGLRNPFRFSFDRLSGALYAGDVGQGAVEEIDIITAGGNYGWRVYEGTSCTNIDPGSCSPGSYIAPIVQYGHGGGRCSVTGGYVYRGTRQTLAAGTYLYADYCTGEIFALAGGVSTRLLDTALNISSFGEDEDEDGEIYVVGLGGTVHRIVSSRAASLTIPIFLLLD